jgi:hypothetical protein
VLGLTRTSLAVRIYGGGGRQHGEEAKQEAKEEKRMSRGMLHSL